jgi:hypothetical protein
MFGYCAKSSGLRVGWYCIRIAAIVIQKPLLYLNMSDGAYSYETLKL